MGPQLIGSAILRRAKTQTPVGTASAPAGAARVVPTPRQWQPRWLLGVAALVLAGGLLVGYALPAYVQREPVVVLARDVPAGAVLSAADVSTTDVSVDRGVAVVRPGDGVLGKTALVDLSAGSVLSPRQVGSAPPLTPGQSVVPLRLTLGQHPQEGLGPGALVLAVPAPADPSGAAAAAASQQAPVTATVVGVGDPDPATGDVVVDVRVADGDAVRLARVAATGSITLLALPGGGS